MRTASASPQPSGPKVGPPQPWTRMLRASSSARATLMAGLLVAALTALPPAVSWLLPGLRNTLMAPQFAELHGPTHPAVWLFVVFHLLLLVVTRKRMDRDSEELPPHLFRLQLFNQLAWLQLLAWFAIPHLPSIGITLLVGLTVGCAVRDALSRVPIRSLQVQYLLAFPAFDLVLLAMDALGGPGLLHTLAVEPGHVFQTLALQAVLIGLTQALLVLMGRTVLHHDVRLLHQERTERELALMRTEKDILGQSSVLLGQGLAASQFSHDVASPLTVIRACVEELQLMLAESPYQDRDVRRILGGLDPHRGGQVADHMTSWNASASQVLEDLDEYSSRIMSMTGSLARSLRGGVVAAPQSVEDLVEQATEAMGTQLRSQDRTLPGLKVTLEPALVQVTRAHAGSLANLMTNGVLHAPDTSLEIRGEVLDPWYYRLVVRDYGVSAEERTHALQRIRHSLRLCTDHRLNRSRGQHRGYGVALMLAKVLMVRHHGWMAAAPPDEGRGIEIHLVLPRVEHEVIPAQASHPGRYLAELQAMTA